MKSFAKVNIALKIVGKRDNYHTIFSRFMRVKNLFDEIEFIKQDVSEFTIIGDFSCLMEQNTVYKAYNLIKNSEIEDFFKSHIVVIKKSIPEFSGLGGGSSNCATFLLMVNEVLNLGLSKSQLASIGVKVGADVPFFIYGYDSANVSGIGEVIENFNEDILDIEIFTPPIKCDTKAVYLEFSKNFYKEFKDIETLKKLTSKELLNQFDIEFLNDLYLPAVAINPKLKEYQKQNYYFSGSGSSFFYLK